MGVYLELVSFDEVMRTSRVQPTIVNDVVESSAEKKEKFNARLYTKYTDDLLSNIPACECGETTGEYNLGIPCEVCKTVVRRPQGDLEPVVWMRAPNGVVAMINPTIWIMLSEKFTKSGFNLVRWFADSRYNPDGRIPAFMPYVEGLGFKRGYNNFVNNFDAIMAALFDMKAFKTPNKFKKDAIDPLYELIQKQRHCIFSQCLPVPNKTLLVVEETNSGTYVDPVLTGAIDAVRTLVGIDTELSNFSLRDKENRTIKAIDQLSEFYSGVYSNFLAKKEGICRKHVFGTRSHFSFRTVISSLTDPHQYDEIHIPWGVATSVLKLHLVNKLLRRGFTPNEALEHLYKHANKHDPLLEYLFEELIAESPIGGIPVIFQRNPSLERGSAQALRITKVKTNVDINTVSLSILIVKAYNADFDGDALNCTLSLDNYTTARLASLAPHKSTFGLDNHRGVSTNLSMPKPVIATVANWLDTDD